MDRIAAFKQFIEKDPSDPFPRYSLAMEYKNQGNHDEAQVHFDYLLEHNADYVPAYFHGAANLRALGRTDDAVARYTAGIEVATKAGDIKTRDELQAALAEIQ